MFCIDGNTESSNGRWLRWLLQIRLELARIRRGSIDVQAVMVAWAQAMIPPSRDMNSVNQHTLSSSSQQSSCSLSTQTSDTVAKVLASVSDPFVELQSRTKHLNS